MKKIFLALAIVIILLLSCDEHDGLILKDSKGNYYKLKHSIGDAYFIRKHKFEKKF